MIDLVVLVVSIAVVDSLNPTTILPALYLATAPRPVRGILGFAAGFFAVNVVGGVAVLGLGHQGAGLLPRPRQQILHWGELVIGVAVLVGAGILWHRRLHVGVGVARAELGAHRFAPLAGATIAAVELPTAFPYVVVIAALAASDQRTAVQITLLVVFNVLFLAPVVMIATVRAFAGGLAAHRLTRIRSLALRHAGSVVAGLAFALGVVLVVLGSAGLAGSS